MESPPVTEILEDSSPLHISIPDCFVLEFSFTKKKKKKNRKKLENILKILFNIK